MSGKEVGQVLMGVLEGYGRRMSAVGATEWLDALREYPEAAIVAALRRWRDTREDAPTPAGLRGMLDPGSQWPSADEAWAVVAPVLGREDASVVWCREMALAAGEVEHLDPVAGRMAFRAAYERLVAEAKRQGGRPEYYLSPGWDPEGREAAVREALRLGWVRDQRQVGYRGGDPMPALPAPAPAQLPAEFRALVAHLRGH